MYYIVYSLLWLLSLLPLRFLYFISDCIYFIIFYCIGYRKKIVLQNLQKAYPEKSTEEIKKIVRSFYHKFIDSMIESIKLFSADNSFIRKHVQMDFSAFDHPSLQNKPFQIHAGHQFNWEYLNLALSLQLKQPLVAVYMPIKSAIFEKMFHKIRSKNGTVLLPATDLKNRFQEWRNKPHGLVLVADQSPGDPNHAFWLPFFNQLTPFVKGPERHAREKACPVVFIYTRILKRGYYELKSEILTEDASKLGEGELTRLYVKRMTEVINVQPENWLWSHRRWKHQWKPEYGSLEHK
jgi:KDO2-lipid IV(A) lauroyltransferase